MTDRNEFHTVTPETADAIWFVGTLATIKAAGARTGGAVSIVEFEHPTGFATPEHIHTHEDEGFYVLEGAMKGFCGDTDWLATKGSFVWLPRGIGHGFASVGPDRLRCLAITVPAGFERFVAEAGQPALQRTLPHPSEPDMEHLLAAHARHGLQVVGPPRP